MHINHSKVVAFFGCCCFVFFNYKFLFIMNENSNFEEVLLYAVYSHSVEIKFECIFVDTVVCAFILAHKNVSSKIGIIKQTAPQ